MKRFISIPNQFKGVSETDEECIFSVMTDRNASGFVTTFGKAEDLFRRLADVSDQFKVLLIFAFGSELKYSDEYLKSNVTFIYICFP